MAQSEQWALSKLLSPAQWWKYDVGKAEWHVCSSVCASSGVVPEPPVRRAAFLRSFESVFYFPIVGSAFSLPLTCYWEMDSLAKRVWLILQLGVWASRQIDGYVFRGAACFQFMSPWYVAFIIPKWKGPKLDFCSFSQGICLLFTGPSLSPRHLIFVIWL